jgi:hypothetical protein
MLHAESKRNEQERHDIQGRYEEAMQVLNETQSTRLKVITEQHELTTAMLLDQFRQEVQALKQAHLMQMNRMKDDIKALQERQQEELQRVKEEYYLQAKQKDERVKEMIEEIKTDIELSFNRRLEKETVRLEESRLEYERTVKEERDRQIKQVIDKLYEEHRLELRKIKDKYRTQASVRQSLVSPVVTGKTPGFIERPRVETLSVSSFVGKVEEGEDEIVERGCGVEGAETVQGTLVLRLAEVSTQTVSAAQEASTLTDHLNDVKDLEDKCNSEFELLRSHFEAVLMRKNSAIDLLEEQLKEATKNIIQYEGLLRELAST